MEYPDQLGEPSATNFLAGGYGSFSTSHMDCITCEQTCEEEDLRRGACEEDFEVVPFFESCTGVGGRARNSGRARVDAAATNADRPWAQKGSPILINARR